MKLFEVYKLHAAKERLAAAVIPIAERYRTAGRVLTWRLIHEIEKEALSTLKQAGDLDWEYVRMATSSEWGYVPRINQPADLEGYDELPIALTTIHRAYNVCH